ncbi:restriction endonuclease subunit S [Eikenella sp. Marseille-P7795]|uniref:restriction endonuclease subunit S n=1 Tax=Eikenella sp. Marseille-P7795 TaxID=2866577 RepID=UPI001CE3E564|nr:restriction endonuclease subunit S [Eikenella sp. Marseille-P7795]
MSKIPLNEFITLQRGFDLPSSKRIAGNVPVVASTGIAGYHNEIKVKAPGVVIGRSGSIGGGQYIEKDFFPLNTTLYVKDFKGHYPRFIYYLLKSIDFTSFNVGTGVPTLNRNHLSSILISDLGIDKEKEIANILGSLDAKIQLNTQINQTLEHIAQAIFKSWFVDFDPVRAKTAALRDGKTQAEAELAAMSAISGKTAEELTAFEPERYAELAEIAAAFPNEMGEVDGVEVPRGWEVKSLDEIANYQNGLALQKFRPEGDEPFLPVVKITQLRQGYADGEEKAKASIKPECIIDNGDIVFSWSGSLLVDIWCGGKAALNQHLFKVTSETYPKWFYYFYTKHHLAEFQRIAYDKAVTMGHIKREHLSGAMCVVPNDELLANNTIGNLLEKIVLNRLENINLQNTRDLLLPRLLNNDL